MASKYPGWTPYNYCLNNPVIFIDPKGEAVGFTQVEGRVAVPLIAWAGVTGSAASGIMYDGTNFARYTTVSLGGSVGGGGAVGVASGILSNNSVYDTEGWGVTGGVFAGAFTNYNLGGEVNFTFDSNSEYGITGMGGTYSKGLAFGGAGYAEGTYTWLHEVGTLNDIVNGLISSLNDNGINLESLGITRDQLNEYINNMVSQTDAENEQKEDKYDDEN